ncbi:MAG: hypothetical protein ACM3U2_18410, partial [Deltaproteobacteria bacterium]
MFRSRWILRLTALLPVVALGSVLSPLAGRGLHAAEVKLKNKMVLRGVTTDLESLIVNKPTAKKKDPDEIVLKPIVMITTSLKRYFVSRRQIEEENKDVPLNLEGFK